MSTIRVRRVDHLIGAQRNSRRRRLLAAVRPELVDQLSGCA